MVDFVKQPITLPLLRKRAMRLQIGWNTTGGRNSSGQITSYKKGSFKYHRIYRFIDFWRRLKLDAFILDVVRDNFRSVQLSLVFYQTGFLSYIVLPEGHSVGDRLFFSATEVNDQETALFPGNALALADIPEGSFIFHVELWPLKGAQICRAAGTYALISAKRKGFATLKLRSGWKLVLSDQCYGVLGVAPNYARIFQVLRKAGRRVNLGRRPTVRGVAMNAIDHPHGGGRGKTSGRGPRPRTPWGKITKQRKTVSKKIRAVREFFRFR